MRVLVAGATGVLGRQLVPRLAANGHHVIGIARRHRPNLLTTPNVEMVTADALNRAALTTVVQMATPDAVVNLLSAIPGRPNPRRLAEQFRLTNRLRVEGTRNLLAAAATSGAQRILAEGLAYAYDPDGSEPADEEQPLWQRPPRQFAPVVKALVELERQTRDAGGLVLRLGHLYGPGDLCARRILCPAGQSRSRASRSRRPRGLFVHPCGGCCHCNGGCFGA